MRNGYSFLDRCVMAIDAGLKQCATDRDDRQIAASLMRINHTGEICAQALYRGQALVADNAPLINHLNQAAEEEQQHLQWCSERLVALETKPSLFNPVFALGSFGIGMMAGLCGEALSLGFVAETEKQVGAHLEKHLEIMPLSDTLSRAILEKMQIDEEEHATQAIAQGARPLPRVVCWLMQGASKIMTTVTGYI